MIDIPDLTPDLLASLGRELGGCDFTDASQTSFLVLRTSCDVQSVPGNGKTTLLAAKLALLSRNWRSRAQGVCVMSHTNAARDEVQKALVKHPATSAFLSYPHFIGTVTGFIDQYLALPYLRGLGWIVRHIDDDAFEATALNRYRAKQHLCARSRMRDGQFRYQVEVWVKNLELASDFECAGTIPPVRLSVRQLSRQHGPHTDCGRELEELKAELVADGLFRFGDMTALACKALDVRPSLAERLRERFPLVLLDEAQDTNGSQLKLLNRIFGGGTVAFQRLGDSNQTLYADFDVAAEKCWRPEAEVIPLTTTRRFGPEIAEFASRLTARSPQHIVGRPGIASRRTLLLFDRASIGRVIPAFATEVRLHWEDGSYRQREVWAVASRHSVYDTRGNWPRSLVDYHPTYRAETGTNPQADTLCRMMQKASLLHASGKPIVDVLAYLNAGMIQYLTLNGFVVPAGRRLTSLNLWRILSAVEGRPGLAVRRLFRDCVLYGTAPWNGAAWARYCDELKACLRLPAPPTYRATSLTAYLAFADADAVGPQLGQEQSPKHTAVEGVTVRLGSIHSVKGRTVDAILVVESEVWRANQKVMDLETVLPHAFGIATSDFSANEAQLAAATNVFVGITRPRQVLALALRREVASDALLAAALQQGWNVHDLSRPE